jgi:esterase/lipase
MKPRDSLKNIHKPQVRARYMLQIRPVNSKKRIIKKYQNNINRINYPLFIIKSRPDEILACPGSG